ncbi:MAG: hydrolase [Candidatus Onthoplasma sp.]
MNKTIEEIKQEYINIFKKNIKRDGADKLLDYLENQSDFFFAPASSRRHSNFDGGLAYHSIKVYNRFKKNIQNEYGENYQEHLSEESIAIIALLHDICKTGNYIKDLKNQKINGQWVQVPYYAYNQENSLPFGHGEKSVYMISSFIHLTREEAIAINWHMGGFDARAQMGDDLSNAFLKYPNALLFHISDYEATYIDEEIIK